MMPVVKKVQLSPEVTPEGYYSTHEKELGIAPDGTGLQILFKVEDNYFVLAGPRAGSILTVNGGRIEDTAKTFLAQIQEEVSEETFGVLNIVSKSGLLHLRIKDNRDYPLNMCANHTVLKSKPGRYAYATFSAVCEGLSLEQLKGISDHISPTAHFWAKLGGFLFSQIRKAPQDDTFPGYWQQQLEELNKLLTDLTEEYKQLSAEDKLLVTPETAFSVDTIGAAWDALRQVKDYDTLKHTFQHTVGRFSERAGYYVFKAVDLLMVAQGKPEQIRDVDGAYVAESVFNNDAVAIAFPAIGVMPPMVRPAPPIDSEEPMCAKQVLLQDPQQATWQPGLFGTNHTVVNAMNNHRIDRAEVIDIDIQLAAEQYISKNGPGAGLIMKFVNSDGEAYIVADERGNPESGKKELQSCFGGFVPDLSQNLKIIFANNVAFEAQGTLSEQMGDAEYGDKAFIFDKSDWGMSYLTGVATIKLELDDLKYAVKEMNNALGAVDRTIVPQKFLKKFDFGIYKLSDVVNAAQSTCKMMEGQKPAITMMNYLKDQVENIVIFDDIAVAAMAEENVLTPAPSAQKLTM